MSRARELVQAAHEPAGTAPRPAPRRRARSSTRRPREPAAGRLRVAPRAPGVAPWPCAPPGAREPHEAGFVVVAILDALAQDRAAVDLRREQRAERRPPARPAASIARDGPHRLGGRARRQDPGVCQLAAQERRALPRDLWVGDDGVDLLQLERLARDQRMTDPEQRPRRRSPRRRPLPRADRA